MLQDNLKKKIKFNFFKTMSFLDFLDFNLKLFIKCL